MAEKISDVMTAKPVALSMEATVAEAARCMRDENIGDVLVMEDDHLCGIITDRDIVVRGLADGKPPDQMKLGDICTHQVITITPQDEVTEAVNLMRDKAVRRLVVMDDDKPVGVVSLGDLAVDRDRHSVLGEISAASPNN